MRGGTRRKEGQEERRDEESRKGEEERIWETGGRAENFTENFEETGRDGIETNGEGNEDSEEVNEGSEECHEEVEYEYGFCPDGGGLMEFPVARAKDDDGNEIIPEKPALTSSNLAALRGRRYAREIADGARRAFNAVKHAVFEPHHDGLVPSQVSCETAQFDRRSAITLGARGDSYYEKI